MKIYLLGTEIDTNSRNWEATVMNKLDDARERGASNDLCIMAYALLQGLSTTTHLQHLDDEKENR